MVEDYDVVYTGGDGFAFLGLLMGFIMFASLVGLVFYVITAIFLMKIAKTAEHKTPWAAWIPLWNTVLMLELGGLRKPWIWVLILVGGGLLSAIPVIGWVISLCIFLLSIMLTVWLAKGVQRAVGVDNVGGIVLAVLIPWIWVIWMSSAASKNGFNRQAAFDEGATFPLKWFASADPSVSFGGYGHQMRQAPPASPQSGYTDPSTPPPSSSGPPTNWGAPPPQS